MTAKEKAIYLFNKFDSFDFHELADHKESAKDGALIVVDEILQSYKQLSEDDDIIFPKETNYWQEVKEEINKI